MLGSLTILNIALTFVLGYWNHQCMNLVDSMDGLVVGLAAIASAFFMLVTVDAGQTSLSLLSAILLGSSIGMMYFNALPARTFLGDSGAQFLGFVLAALAIAYTPPGLPQPSSWFVPILLLSVPIFDTTLVTISRLQAEKGSLSSRVGSHIPSSGKLGLALFPGCTHNAFICHCERMSRLYGFTSCSIVGKCHLCFRIDGGTFLNGLG